MAAPILLPRFVHTPLSRWRYRRRVTEEVRRSTSAALDRLQGIRATAHAAAKPLVGVVLAEHVGDILACEPVISHLRARHPYAWIVWLTRKPFVELVGSHPDIDAVVEIPALTSTNRILDSGFLDLAVDLHLEGKVCSQTHARHSRRKGQRQITAANYYDHGSLLEALSEAAGLPRLDGPPHAYLPPAIRHSVDRLGLPSRYVVVHTRSNEAARNWTDEGWAAFARAASDRWCLPVVEVGLEQTLPAARQIHSLAGKLTLAETAEVIRRAVAFAGIDSGPAHMANAFERPSLVLLGAYRGFPRYLPYTGFLRHHAAKMVIQWDGPVAQLPASVVLDHFERLNVA